MIARLAHRYRDGHTHSVPLEHLICNPPTVVSVYNMSCCMSKNSDAPLSRDQNLNYRPAARNPAPRSASFHVRECTPPRLLIGVCTVVARGFPLDVSADNTLSGALKMAFTSARNRPFTPYDSCLGASRCPCVVRPSRFFHLCRSR